MLYPPYRAEHVGSLLRPKELTHAFRAHHKGDLDEETFTEIQDKSIRDVVAMQEEIGLRLVTDGEFRRGSYWGHFIGPVKGICVKEAVFTFHDDKGQEQHFIAPHIEGKVRRSQGISITEYSFLKNVATATPKITMPAPSAFHFWRGTKGIDADAYTDVKEYFADLAQVYQDEIAELAHLGARYITQDEVALAMLCDPEIRSQVEAWGLQGEELVSLYIDAINAGVSKRPKDMIVALHLCRGNFKGKYLSQGGYEIVAEQIFNQTNVNAFFLEYDDPRSGDFTPLRFVPKDKRVVLGLVSSKTPELEKNDDLRRRVDEASQYIAREQLSISPQCGFASAVSGNPVTIDDQKRKLALLVETAHAIWGEA